MTPSEAASHIGCSPQQVRTLIRSGTLKANRVESKNNQHGFVYDVDWSEAERYRLMPQVQGFPRGRKRKNDE